MLETAEEAAFEVKAKETAFKPQDTSMKEEIEGQYVL